MSYRHSNYRKLKKAYLADVFQDPVSRHHVDRQLHWGGETPLPKPAEWGMSLWWRQGEALMRPEDRAR